jgi:hypothetical protein
MGEVVVSGERVMAVLTGEGGWTVKKSGGESVLGEKSGESVLESALRLVGERSGVVGKARDRGRKKKRKNKTGSEQRERRIEETRKRLGR